MCYFVRLVVFLTLLAGGWSAAGAATVELGDTTHEILIGKQLELLEDPSGKASLPEVQASTQWQPSQVDEPNLGFTESALWARFQVRVDSVRDTLWYLQINDAILNQIDVYFLMPGNNVLHKSGGGWTAVSARDIPYRTHVFQIPESIDGRITVYLRIHSQLALVLPIRILDAGMFNEINTLETWVYSLYFGFVSAMFLFNLVVWLRLDDQTNLYYCGFSACILTLSLSFSGLGKMFFWQESQNTDNILQPLCISLVAIAGNLFTQRFLFGAATNEVFAQHIRLRVLYFLSGVSLLLLMTNHIHMSVITGGACAMLALGNIMMNIFLALSKKNPNAPLLLLAWSGFITGSLIWGARGFGWISSTPLTTNAVQIGSTFECFVLVVGLIERSRHLRDELADHNATLRARLEAEVATRSDALLAAGEVLSEQEKQRSLSLFSRSLTKEMHAPSMLINRRASIVSERMTHFERQLTDMSDGDTELAGEFSRHFGKMRDSLGIMNAGAQRIHRILEQLDAGTAIDNSATTPLNEVLTAIVEASPGAIALNLSHDINGYVPGDAQLLKKVFGAIVDNARDAIADVSAESAVSISIVTLQQDSTISITISDTGKGISQEHTHRIFDPFFTTKPVGSGVGLGLTVARTVLTALGGQIQIAASSSQGTTIMVTLPVVAHHAQAAA